MFKKKEVPFDVEALAGHAADLGIDAVVGSADLALEAGLDPESVRWGMAYYAQVVKQVWEASQESTDVFAVSVLTMAMTTAAFNTQVEEVA